jgi:septation ring formation regulator EzrA
MITFITIAILAFFIYKMHMRLKDVDPEYKAIIDQDEAVTNKAITDKLSEVKALSGSLVGKVKAGISKWK